jgi:alcohol dehydrogenase class IV
VAGAVLSDLIKGFMRDFRVPNGLSELGFERSDVDRLTGAAMNSLSALQISPRDHTTDAIAQIYEDSFTVY